MFTECLPCVRTQRDESMDPIFKKLQSSKKNIYALIQNNLSIKETIQCMQIDGMKKESKAFIYTF